MITTMMQGKRNQNTGTIIDTFESYNKSDTKFTLKLIDILK